MPIARIATLLFALSSLGPATRPSAHPTEHIDERCASASSQVEVLGCYLDAAATSRVQVRQAFERNLRSAKAIEDDFNKNPNANALQASSLTKVLMASQTAWVEYSNAECSFEGQTSFGGSGEDILEAKCHHRQNLMRVAELQADHDLVLR